MARKLTRSTLCFKGEQLLLDGKAATVSGESAITSNHAMAGNDDGNRIGAIRQADCTRGFGIADAVCEFAIRDCFSVRDFTEMAPNIFLKRSTFRSEANVEFFQLAGEVGAKLADRLFQRIRALVPC